MKLSTKKILFLVALIGIPCFAAIVAHRKHKPIHQNQFDAIGKSHNGRTWGLVKIKNGYDLVYPIDDQMRIIGDGQRFGTRLKSYSDGNTTLSIFDDSEIRLFSDSTIIKFERISDD